MSACLSNSTHSALRKSPPPARRVRDVGVLLQEELDIFDAGRAVSVDILHFLDLDGDRLGLLALAITLVVLTERELCAGDRGPVVAGGDELFEAELVEVGGEVLEEVALEWVVAVAVDDLAAEGVGVELQVGLDLFLDIDVQGVELVLLGIPRFAQAFIICFFLCFLCHIGPVWITPGSISSEGPKYAPLPSSGFGGPSARGFGGSVPSQAPLVRPIWVVPFRANPWPVAHPALNPRINLEMGGASRLLLTG